MPNDITCKLTVDQAQAILDLIAALEGAAPPARPPVAFIHHREDLAAARERLHSAVIRHLTGRGGG
ncbi:MAG: hypothetical protein OXP66_08215 [Candidatus Tectomicrobia bacterium]|nr:hypothetical protein [Candidatus Tectomicrobia bacterium]